MAREFKHYDVKYRIYANSFLPYEDENIASVTESFREPRKYANDVIRNAVYFAEGAEQWQKFRVSLKGMSTGIKLARLQARWKRFAELQAMGSISKTYWMNEQIRIDNYIDALKRSGLVDSNWRVCEKQ